MPSSPLCLARALEKVPGSHRGHRLIFRLDGRPYRAKDFRKDYKGLLRLTPEDKAACKNLGQKLTPHGLRAAGCTYAASLGVPEADVRDHGMWSQKSGSFRRYLRDPQVAHRMA